jgi:hypothetical protein
MSAYIVNVDHIDYLVSAVGKMGRDLHTTLWVDYDPGLRGHGEVENVALAVNPYTDNPRWEPAHSPTTLGRMLLAENIASVQARYPDDEPGNLPGPVPNPTPDTYRYTPVPWEQISAAGVIQAVRCWRHQTCEHDGHEQSLAWAAMTELHDAAVLVMVGESNPGTWNWSRPVAA